MTRRTATTMVVMIVGVSALPLGATADMTSGQLVRAAVTMDTRGRTVDALRGVVVWQRLTTGGSLLMRRVGGQVSRVPGVSRAGGFRSLDLGIDRDRRVVASYWRCGARGGCRGPFVTDVRSGGERPLAVPGRAGCVRGTALAAWADQVAYLLTCDAGRTAAVYVARGGRARRMMTLTGAQAKGATIDVRDGRVALAATHGGVRVAVTDAPRCVAVVDTGDPSVAVGPVHVAGRRVSWVSETIGTYGGGTTRLHAQTVDQHCAARPTGAPRALDRAMVDGFSVDGAWLYLSSDPDGVVRQPLG